MDKKVLYKPFKYNGNANKKYSVYVKADTKSGKKLIHFGSSLHQHYKDKIGEYSHLDHNDKKRRALYYKRHKKATSKDTAKYFSHKYLW